MRLAVQIRPKRSASARSQIAPAKRSERPTAAEPRSLMYAIRGSGSMLTRSPSFSIAVLSSSTIMTRTRTRISASRFHASAATRKDTGTAMMKTANSWRNASSLRAAAHKPCQLLMAARHKRYTAESDRPTLRHEGRYQSDVNLALPTSPPRGADPCRAAAHLERSGGFKLLAVEAQDLDLLLDHALDQEGLAVLAPGRALAPMADLAFGDLAQL